MGLTKFMKDSRFSSFYPFKIIGSFFSCRPAIMMAGLKQDISLECLSLSIKTRKKNLSLNICKFTLPSWRPIKSVVQKCLLSLLLPCINAIFYHCFLALSFLFLHNHNGIHYLQHRGIFPGLPDFSVRYFHPSGC